MSVTIAIPFYNSEEYLEFSIKSVLAQSFTDWELILVDDGSTDGSLKIANSFALTDKRIKVVSDGENKKLPARLNQIISLAKYDLIARMDSDDLMPVFRIERQVEFLKNNPEFDLVTTGVCSINGKNEVIGARIPNTKYQHLTLDKMYKGQHQIVHASVVVKKDWYKRNLYDEKMERAQDYELWMRAFINEDLKIGYLEFAGYYYREDLNITKIKSLKTYEMGWVIIDIYGSRFGNVFRKKTTMILKSLLVRFIFFINCESYLQNRRFKNPIDPKLKEEVASQITLIESIK